MTRTGPFIQIQTPRLMQAPPSVFSSNDTVQPLQKRQVRLYAQGEPVPTTQETKLQRFVNRLMKPRTSTPPPSATTDGKPNEAAVVLKVTATPLPAPETHLVPITNSTSPSFDSGAYASEPSAIGGWILFAVMLSLILAVLLMIGWSLFGHHVEPIGCRRVLARQQSLGGRKDIEQPPVLPPKTASTAL